MLRTKVLSLALGLMAVAAGRADSVDLCGELVRGVECTLLEASDGRRYLLDDPGPFVVGDRIRVVGERDESCVTICQEGNGCITVVLATYCDGPFTACGRLVAGVECVLFEDDQGFLLAIENTAPFAVGDRVLVSGRFDRDCVTICQQTTGCIEDNTIRAAPLDGPCPPEGVSPICSTATLSLTLLAGAGLWRSARMHCA